MNVNLLRLDESTDDSDLNLIGQFFSNLAVWLAPLTVRQEMSRDMFEWVASHTEVREERGHSDAVIGVVRALLPRADR